MLDESANAEQSRYWNEVGGPHWVSQQLEFDEMLGAFGRGAMDELRIRENERVIDIGCGTGTTTLALADAVGPGGEVFGCDISSTMTEAAGARVGSLANVSFAVRDAQVDPLATAERRFDAAYSRFGVMFFSDPRAAFANIAGSLRPGGRIAFACWRRENLNEWISEPARIMRQFTPEPLFPPPGAPGPFSLADGDRVRDLLVAAGWANVRVEAFSAPMVLGGGRGVDSALALTMGTTIAQRMRAQVDDTTFAAAAAAVREVLSDHLVGGAVVFVGNAWIVTADRR